MTLEGFAEDLKRELYRRMEEGSCSGGVNRRIEYRVIQKKQWSTTPRYFSDGRKGTSDSLYLCRTIFGGI